MTNTYGWIGIVVPILIAAPVYFSGQIGFGGLMMAVGAFNQMNSSLRWFINNVGSIADWRATLMRVADFRIALNKTDKPDSNPDRIRQQLSEKNVLVEEWGGKYQSVEISARTGKNVDLLPNRRASSLFSPLDEVVPRSHHGLL